MTLFGSIIMLIIGFVVGYLVSGATRGAANARQGRQDSQARRNQDTVVRQRPVPSHTFAAETGTIGERQNEAQGQQQQSAQHVGPAKPAYSSAQVFMTAQPSGQNQQGQAQAQNVNMQGAQQQADQQATQQADQQGTQQVGQQADQQATQQAGQQATQQAGQQAAIQATPQNTQQTTAQSMTAANQQYQTEAGGSLGTQGQMSQAAPAKKASDSAHVFMNTESGPTNQRNQNQNQGSSQQ